MTPSDTQRVIDYWICTARDTIELSSRIKQMIEQGWQPFGSFTVYADSSYEGGKPCTYYGQPLVKYVPRTSVIALSKYMEERDKKRRIESDYSI
jgi:hypothetical protein